MKKQKQRITEGIKFFFLPPVYRKRQKKSKKPYEPGTEPTTKNSKFVDDKLKELYPLSYAFIRFYTPLAIDLILDIRKMETKVEMGFYDGTVFIFTNCRPVQDDSNDMCNIHMRRIKRKKVILDCNVNEDWINEISKYIEEKDIKYITVDL